MCDCPYPGVLSDRIVRAKKPYQCEECGDTIAAGEKYHSIFGVWDHEPGSYRFCCNCRTLKRLELLPCKKNGWKVKVREQHANVKKKQ